MEEAKSSIKNLTSQHGHHSTTVHEHHKPSVTHEHVTPTRHDEGTTVVDREVHQDHYHTAVQPIHHREVLPEQHKHNLLPTETKEFHHGDSDATNHKLAAEAAHYKSATETGPAQFTTSVNPEVGGEHVHHHIHETIQPVIQKETIQPTVVHTTKPIHEVHHNQAQHHAATVLPAVGLDEFKHGGGSLSGAKDRITHYEGEPGKHGLIDESHRRAGSGGVGAAGHGTTGAGVAATGVGPTARVTNEEPILHRERPHEGHAGATMDTSAPLGETTNRHHHHSHDSAPMDSRVDSRKNDLPIAQEFAGHGGTGASAAGTNSSIRNIDEGRDKHGNGALGAAEDKVLHSNKKHDAPTREFADTHLGAGASGNTTGVSNFESANIRHGHEEKKKPSLLDKLNPLKDADGDGKKGIMH